MTLKLSLAALALAILSCTTSADTHAQVLSSNTFASRAAAAVDAYLELWHPEASAAIEGAFEEDAALEYAHSDPELSGHISGRQSMITHVRAVAQLGENWSFSQRMIFPTLYPDVYFAQYTASGQLRGSAERFERNVIVVVQVGPRGALRLIEFSNPAIAQSHEASRGRQGEVEQDAAALVRLNSGQ